MAAKSQPPPVMTNEAVFGAVLRRHREIRGMDQVSMCQKVGVTQPYWSKVEQGRANPSTGVIRKACEVLGITEAEFHSQVQRVRQEAEARGVKILDSASLRSDDWLPIVAGVAIIALIALVLGKKSK